MDMSSERAEEIMRHASKASASVGPRVINAMLAQLDRERADHKRLVRAYWQQEYQMYLASEERRQGGETGSNPPPPIAPPADAAKLLAPLVPMQPPAADELCPDDHDMWTNDDGSCGACEMLRSLKA